MRMKAERFYQTQSAEAVSLLFLSPDALEEKQKEASPFEKNMIRHQQFTGKSGEICLLTNEEGVLLKIYVGVEKNDRAKALACAALKVPPGFYQLNEALPCCDLIYWALAQYRFAVYKKYDEQPRVLLLQESDSAEVLSLVDAVFLVRDLINFPAGDMGPEALAEEVRQLAEAHGAEFKQWVGDELLQENYPAIHAVGRAAQSAPRLLSLSWGDSKLPLLTLVGKGVCFDSGGLDIKPAQAMRLMKKDMGGAAQVLGLAQWIMSTRLPVRLQVYIPALENAVGPDAFRPGDVISMRNGSTVEVDNTDAEGRLVLADALVKACEQRPELLIDFATLTGAARVAVGTGISALFANEEKLAAAIITASKAVSDPVWQLPLFAAYTEMLRSNVADLSNGNDSPYAGAITAALFLQHFIPADIAWAHFDVMAWNLGSKPGKPEGGEAMGIRAVVEYLKRRFSKGSDLTKLKEEW